MSHSQALATLPTLVLTSWLLYEQAQASNESRQSDPSIKLLVESLNHGDVKTRRNAAQELGYQGREAASAVPALIEAVDDPEVGPLAVEALGHLGATAESAIPRLVALLGHDQPSARGWHRTLSPFVLPADVVAVGRMGTSAVPALIEKLGQGGVDTRIECSLALGQIGSEAALPVPSLVQVLDVSDGEDWESVTERRTIAWALGRIGPAAFAAGPSLERRLGRHDLEGSFDEEYVLALTRIGRPPIHLFRKAIAERNDDAIRILSWMGPAGAALMPELNSTLMAKHADLDPDYVLELRGAVIYAIGRMGPPGAPGVPEIMRDIQKTGYVDYWNALALGRIGPAASPSLSLLMQSLEDDKLQDAAADAVIDALVRIDPDGATVVPCLVARFTSERLVLEDAGLDEVKMDIATAFGRVGTGATAAVPALIAALQGGDRRLGGAAADALGCIGPNALAAVPALVAALEKDFDAETATALGRIGPGAIAAVPTLLRSLDGVDRRSFEAAIVAIARIEPSRRIELRPIFERRTDDLELEARIRIAVALGLECPQAEVYALDLLEAVEYELRPEVHDDSFGWHSLIQWRLEAIRDLGPAIGGLELRLANLREYPDALVRKWVEEALNAPLPGIGQVPSK